MQPSISAIVLNFQTPLQTVRCVDALRAQTRKPDEIIVIDNHSSDESIGILRNRLKNFPEVRIIETPDNVGFSKGYNLSLRHAKSEFFLLNNPAKILAPDALERMASAMEADPSIGILGPKLVYDDGTVRDSYRTFPALLDVIIKRTVLQHVFTSRLQHYLQSGTNVNERRDTDWVIGGCLMIRADLMHALKGFDPRFFLFFEDIDLCRRCWATGKRVVYFPDATALDRKRRLSEGGIASLLCKKVGRAHLKSAMQYFWKWRSPLAEHSVNR